MRIVKYETDNCSYCKSVGKYLEEKGIKYENVNIMDAYPELCAKFNILSVPVTILFDNEGNEVLRSTGYKIGELNNIISLYRGESK